MGAPATCRCPIPTNWWSLPNTRLIPARATCLPAGPPISTWTQALTSFEALGAFQTASVNISRDSAQPERLEAAFVTSNTFTLLQIGAARGRVFAAADLQPGAPDVAVISYSLWRGRFGGDDAIVGRTIRLDGRPRTVIGVMPPRFGFPINTRVWLPLDPSPAGSTGPGDDLRVFGRLRRGVSADAARRELQTTIGGLAASNPEIYHDRRAQVLPFTEMETPADIRRTLELLVALVSLVLLVACANVANLLLARAAARSRETAIQVALGASRARLVSERLVEAVVLAAVAGVAGLLLAHAGLKFFAAASSGVLDAFWVDFRVDPTVVAFATLIGLAAAVAAGLVPALRASAAGIGALMKDQSTSIAGLRIGRLGRWLVVAQLALACGLLGVTATFTRASAALRAVDIPFPARQILTAQLSVRQSVLDSVSERNTLVRRLHETLAASPDVTASALVSVLPGRGAGHWTIALPDSATAGDHPLAGVTMVTPEFFDLAEAGAVRGRLFTWQDDDRAAPVTVVNQSFARRFFADGDPLGRRVRLGTRDLTIVGVVRDLLMQDVEDLDGTGLYVPLLQARPYAVRVMARTVGAPRDSVGALRRAVAEVDPDLPILEAATLYDAIYADKGVLDAVAVLFLCFGLGAVFLALIGLYAVLSFVVTQRTREFGVRMALGATRGDIVRLVLRRGSVELAWGLTIGMLIAFGLSKVLAASMERLPPGGPSVFVAILLTVSIGASLAMWWPMRRAAGLAPADALRVD